MKLLVLFVLSINVSNNSCTLLTEKAAFFANLVFKEFITSVVWWHDKSDGVTDFIKLFQGCIVVAPLREDESSNAVIREFNIDKHLMQTVFFASEVHEVEYFVSLLYQDLVIPIRLMVVLTKPASYTELTELMKIAWLNDVADILIMSSNNENLTLTTYFPYRYGKCGDFTPVHLKHDTKDLFPKKFTNFHGCEIRTTLLHMSPYSRLQFGNNRLVSMSGIDGNVLNIIFDKLNAKMNVTSAKDHGGLGTIVNGSATGSFADLVNKQADILLPGLLMTSVRYPYVQFSHPHETITIIWFGPRRREISEWLRVLQPFMSHVTSALFGTSIVFIVVIFTIRRFGLYRSSSGHSVIFQTFTIFLGIEVKLETKSFLTNYLFVLWIWFCMVVRIAYQGDLVDGLQKTALETPLRTFESAVKLVEGYGESENNKDFLSDTQYYNNYKIIPFGNISNNLKAIEVRKRFLIATDMKLGLDSAPNIQILDDDPITSGPVCFHVRPGWPAFANIDSVLLHMIETGFVEKVNRDHYWEWAKAIETNTDRSAKPLTLENLLGCFYGLGVMYGICTLALFIEIFLKKNEA